MGFGKLKLIMLLLAGIVFYAACRKIDFRPEKEREKVPADERFFTRNISSNPLVQSLAAYMKRRNEKDSFVNTTVSRIGYPRWDKSIISAKQGVGISSGRGASDSVTLIYVPFVRENENFVNASLVAEFSPTDTSFSYICDWQYYEKQFGSPATDTTAEAWASTLMILDKKVFGHTSFAITDTSLFKINFVANRRDSVKRKVFITDTSVSGRYSRGTDYYHCVSETVYQIEYHCTGCSGTCDLCPVCVTTSYSTFVVCNLVTGGGSGSGNNNGNGNSGGSGGGNSGGGTPPNCNPTAVRGFNANPNCEPGWQPDPPPPPPPPPINDTLLNPCFFADLLENQQSFKDMLQDLKNHSNNHNDTSEHMWAYEFLPGGIFSADSSSGRPGEKGIDIDILIPVDGVAHNHFVNSLSIFSPRDLWSMCILFNKGLMKDSSIFTMPLVTAEGTQYMLMIENLTKFRKWAKKYYEMKYIISSTSFAEKFKIRDSNTNEQNEIRFLQYLSKEYGGSGLKLFRGNQDFSEWTPIKLDANNNVITAPCQ